MIDGMADPTNSARSSRPTTPSFDAFASQYLLRLSTDIVHHGFAFVPVGFGTCSAPGCDCGTDDDSWAYTVGLVELGLPEIIVIGLAPAIGAELVGRVVAEHRRGGRVILGAPMWVDGVLVKLVDVPPEWLAHDLDRMTMWVGHYGPGRSELRIPPVAQLLFADGDGRFADDPGCDPLVAELQPVLRDDPAAYPKLLHRRTRRRSVIRRSAA